MIDVKIHHCIGSLKDKWLTLQSTGLTSVYQSYYVQNAIFKRMPIYMMISKYIPIYCEVIEDGKTVLIAPLCKVIHSKKYCLLGDFNGVQIYDFIYEKQTDRNKLKEYISAVINKLNAKEIMLNNVLEESPLYLALQEMDDTYQFITNGNVNIRFGSDYEEYFQSLSKHTRQNIRTAYNRLNNDNIKMKFEILRGKRLSRNKLNRLIDIYCDRHKERYGLGISKIKRAYLKYIDFSTACQQNYEDNFYALLYFDNNIAAFMSGLFDEGRNSAIIPRLSIDDNYSWYSPGMILINETAKRFTGGIGIENLDLSKGEEKYKQNMGGNVYKTYKILIN